MIPIVALWLWFTVLFANFAEALAEGRSKAQADALRGQRRQIIAKKLYEPRRDAQVFLTASSQLAAGMVVLVETGDFIPADGEVIAVLSAVIFNALIIVALIPLAIMGVAYRPVGAAAILRRNLLVYGISGLVAPFIGIKLVDLALVALKLA